MFFKTLLLFVITFMVSKSRCSDRCHIPPTKCHLDDVYCMSEQEKGFRKWYKSKEASNYNIENINPLSKNKLELQLKDKRVDLINVTIYGVDDSNLNIFNVNKHENIYSYNNTLTHNLVLYAAGSALVDLLTGKEVIDDCPLQIEFSKATAWNTLDAVKMKKCDGKSYLKTYSFNTLYKKGNADIKTGLKKVLGNLNQVERADFRKALVDEVVKICTDVVYYNYEKLVASADLNQIFE